MNQLRKKSKAPDFLEHGEAGERLTKAPAQLCAGGRGTPAQVFPLKHFERRQAGAHRQPVFAERGGVDDGPVQGAGKYKI